MQPVDFSDWLLSLSAGFSRFIQIAVCVGTCKCLVICIYLFGCSGSSLWHRASLLQASLAVALELSCHVACGIYFPDQRSNPHRFHCKAESQPLDHQGRPCKCLLIVLFLSSYLPTLLNFRPFLSLPWTV